MTVSDRYASELADVERRHGYVSRAGDPVIPWDEFVSAANDMIAAEAEFRAAMDEANGHLDRLVPPAERYCAWDAYAPKPVQEIYGLFFDTPNSIHPRSDFQFKLTYGKAHRAPLAHMRRKAESFRAFARKVRRTLDRHLTAAQSAVMA